MARGDDRPLSLSVELPVFAAGTAPRVGVAGVGGVASYAHIPAYRRLGFPVALLYDSLPEALATCRESLGVDGEFTRLVHDEREFLDHLPGLGFLDVALPTPVHASFIAMLLDKLGADCPPLLVQKPLADNDAARRIVERASALGVRIGVNLTARWVPPFRKLRELVLAGVPGEHPVVTVLNRGWNLKDGTGWRSHLERLIAFEMAVHHMDLVVWTFGMPATVFAALQHVPDHGVAGDNVAFITLVYDDGLKVVIVEDWTCRDGAASHYHPTGEEIVVSGSRATIVATPREVRVSSGHGEPERYTCAQPWFPEAFAGPPAEFALALRDKRPSPIDATRHLPVLRLMDAVYKSAASRGAVEVPR